MEIEAYEKITDALLRWNLWGNLKERLIEREDVERAIVLMKNKMALIILGIRRCGKSKFSILLVREQKIEPRSIIINFEDPIVSSYIKEGADLLDYLEMFSRNRFKPEIVILDEPTVVEGWHQSVRTLLDTGFSNIVITGSNKSLLERDVSRVLGGRYIELLLYPLSLREFLLFKGEKNVENLAKRELLLNEYVHYGGFPAVVLSDEKHAILSSYFNSIVVNDVALRINVRNIKKLEVVARVLAENPATLLSFSRIAAAAGISKERAESYVNAFEEAYYITLIDKISPKTIEPIVTVKKIVLCDNGFHTLFYAGRGEKKGRLIENVVGLELLRRYGKKNVFYHRSPEGYEVDFVVREGNRISKLIQVVDNVSEKTIKREINAIVKASDIFNTKNLEIITWDYEGERRFNKHAIKFVKLWNWLLESKKK